MHTSSCTVDPKTHLQNLNEMLVQGTGNRLCLENGQPSFIYQSRIQWALVYLTTSVSHKTCEINQVWDKSFIPHLSKYIVQSKYIVHNRLSDGDSQQWVGQMGFSDKPLSDTRRLTALTLVCAIKDLLVLPVS